MPVFIARLSYRLSLWHDCGDDQKKILCCEKFLAMENEELEVIG